MNPFRSIRNWYKRRQQLKQAFRLLQASGVLRPANVGIRYSLTPGKIDQVFPTLKKDKCVWPPANAVKKTTHTLPSL